MKLKLKYGPEADASKIVEPGVLFVTTDTNKLFHTVNVLPPVEIAGGGSGSGSDGLVYVEEATETTRTLTTPPNIAIDEPHIFCYGDGKLVCLSNEPNVGSYATVTYSEDDGTTWQDGTWADPLVTDLQIPTSLVYGNGIFVGGWHDNTEYMVRSTNGVDWEIIAITGHGGECCVGLYFHNNKFYFNGDGGTLFSSDDGITWSLFNTGFDSGAHEIAFGEDKILVAADPDRTILNILDYSGNIVDTHQFVGTVLNVYCYENRFYVNTDDSYPLYTSTDGTNWSGIDINFDNYIDTLVYLNGKYFIESGEECYLFDPVAEQVTLLTDGIQYSFISSYIVEDRYALTIEDTDIYGTIDGYTWTNPIIVYSYIKQLQQGGEDVTAKVAAIIGGNGGSIEDTNTTYSIEVNTDSAETGTYLVGTDGSSVKISNLHDISTLNSQSSITNGRNTSIGDGIKLSQIFGSGHTVGNNLSASLIRGQNHTIGSDVNHVDVSGYKNKLANGADYSTIHGTEFDVTGTHNVTFGVGGKCVINGKANMMAGDLTGSNISGNYNTILCGGGQNIIAGTTADPCQHNVILGSTTTLTSSENCLSLGRLNTINNHNRTTLMGIGLTATRDNQLIVGSYNDETKTGGAFVVANGSADNHSNAMIVYAEGTVTIGHDPIGEMDVVTKHYLEEVLLNGTW